MFDYTTTFTRRMVRSLSTFPDVSGGHCGRCVRCAIGLLALLVGCAAGPAWGQINAQVGGGIQMVGSTAEASVGPGLFVRGAIPLTRDVSVGLGTAGTGYVLEGGAEASYVLDLEAAAIVTLPSPSKSANYLMGGGGLRIPFRSENLDVGPTVHLGLGRLWALQESTLFVEVRPTLYVREAAADFVFPLRAGIIF